MEFVMNELGVLGDHFGLVIIGCAELAIAAVYAGILLSRRTKNIRTKLALRDVEQKFLEEFSGKTDECCIVMENQNRLPLYAAGIGSSNQIFTHTGWFSVICMATIGVGVAICSKHK